MKKTTKFNILLALFLIAILQIGGTLSFLICHVEKTFTYDYGDAKVEIYNTFSKTNSKGVIGVKNIGQNPVMVRMTIIGSAPNDKWTCFKPNDTSDAKKGGWLGIGESSKKICTEFNITEDVVGGQHCYASYFEPTDCYYRPYIFSAKVIEPAESLDMIDLINAKNIIEDAKFTIKIDAYDVNANPYGYNTYWKDSWYDSNYNTCANTLKNAIDTYLESQKSKTDTKK